LSSNSIKEKLDANGWKMYSKSYCEYDVDFFLRHKYGKTPFHISALGNELNKFQFEIVQCVITYET